MIFDALHKHIIRMEWDDVEALLATENGRIMAKEKYKEDLPLHIACGLKAPESTILPLLAAYADAASTRGRSGSFPLHIAAQQKLTTATIVSLIRAYPEALDEKNELQKYPRNYPQAEHLCREALLRPTACWLEDVEKDKYMENLSHRRTNFLREKITELQRALEISSERHSKGVKFIAALESRLQRKEEATKQVETLEKTLKEIELTKMTQIHSIQGRIIQLAQELNAQDVSEEDVMKETIKKKSYVQSVRRQYEKLLERTDQIQKEMQILKVLNAQKKRESFERDRGFSEQTRDDDELSFFTQFSTT